MTALGLPRAHHRKADSTNERAKALPNGGAPHGTLVTADEQTAGRGRQGRAWAAREGTAVLMSVILRDLEERHALLPLTAAVAVCEAAEACAPVRCEIKWPNDVWIDGRKFAGILVEARPQAGWAIVGVGMNVTSAVEDFPDELRATATSLANECPNGGPVSCDAVLCEFLGAFTTGLQQDGHLVLEAWRARDALRGRRITWTGGTGTAAGVDDRGALLVAVGEETLTLEAGEVHLKIDA